MNKINNRIILLALFVFLSSYLFAQSELPEHFLPFKPLLGKTWKGIVDKRNPDKPLYDVSKFELILNGRAIRNTHSVNNGDYGGETIIYWDKEKQELIYYYFTSADFYTHGTFKYENEKLVSHEFVEGNTQGITEVKGLSEVSGDGKLHVKTWYLIKGKWENGRESVYEETNENVIFK